MIIGRTSVVKGPKGCSLVSIIELYLMEKSRTRSKYFRQHTNYTFPLHITKLKKQPNRKIHLPVPLLKDRMLQLRNRYNLEKRRLEQLNLENPHKHMTSPWPLYSYLSFLSNHIRSRRSYKSMMTRSNQLDLMYSNSNSNNGSPGERHDHYEPEHFEGFDDIQVKHEKIDDW